MYKNTLRSILFPLFLAVAVAAGIFIGKVTMGRGSSDPQQGRVAASRFAENKLIYTLSLIDSRYVDKVDIDSITDLAMPRLLAELDPHSTYIPARDFTEVNEALEGEFDGIGVMFNMATDTVVVLTVLPGGPSEAAGVKNGDRIIMIDDSLVAGQKIPQDNILKMLKGKGGTEVSLSVRRQGVDALVPITVTRGKVTVKSVDAAFMLERGIGYLKLSTFSKNSAAEIRKEVNRLRTLGMEKLIFDLRGNTGGFLDQAILIANDFLPGGKLIVYTEYRNKNRREEYSNGEGPFADIDLAVLIDENSASSSEILAGALQDNDRGTVIGRRSFGKGLVQEQIPFRDGSAIRLTVARYYTPTGRSIQKPYDNGADEYRMEIYSRYSHNELFSADSVPTPDESLKFVTPGGKTVYGGGGIMPDIYVPYDTTLMTPYFMQVSGRNILYRYTMEYADRHRDELNGVESVEELRAVLDVDRGLLDDFVRYAKEQGVEPDYNDIAHSRVLLLARLRAFIARNTPLDDAGFYSQIYPVDEDMKKAVEIFKSE